MGLLVVLPLAGLGLLKLTVGLLGPIVNLDFLVLYILAVVAARVTSRSFAGWVTAACLLIFGINIFSGVGLIFVYDPKILLDYLKFIKDWPWRLVLLALGGVSLVATAFYLVMRRARFAQARILPAIALLALFLVADSLAKTPMGFEILKSNNFATSSLATIRHLANGAGMHSKFSYEPQPGASMATDLLAAGAPPARIMSVSVEGMGLGSDPAFNAFLAKRLSDQVAPYYEVEQTTHRFKGLTIAGEFRELCGLKLHFAPNLANVETFAKTCLPSRLEAMGYHTTGMHGNTGFFYARNQLYPALGFDDMIFRNDMLAKGAMDCPSRSFPGICDRDAMRLGLGLFGRQPKEFVHLVTLDTHYPYAPRTPADQVCGGEGAKLSPGICLYRNLFGATMQTIGEQIAAAKVKPDIIYVYGDHAPPYLNERLRDWFSREEVPVYVLRRRPAV